ncbi:MAG: hypothetical protein PHU25_00025 [Deltaproteobacteria bacterium]|nr:hypothetical protein [Deltaproteobacteria bacterium]
MRRLTFLALAAVAVLRLAPASAETKNEYESRFQLMLDWAVRADEFVHGHLGDRQLATYACNMAELNAREAERMTPPAQYAALHPHFLLVLENIERSFHYAAEGVMDKYRFHQKVVRKELTLLETLAERDGLLIETRGPRY